MSNIVSRLDVFPWPAQTPLRSTNAFAYREHFDYEVRPVALAALHRIDEPTFFGDHEEPMTGTSVLHRRMYMLTLPPACMIRDTSAR